MKKKRQLVYYFSFFFLSILCVLYEMIMRNVPDCEKQECNNT